MKCLAKGGTGDPCDAYKAESFVRDELFAPLHIDYFLSGYLNIASMFSLALVGGAPIPIGSYDEVPTDCMGRIGYYLHYLRNHLLWDLWMLTQVAQIVSVLGAIGMYCAAYYGLRHQTEACLLTDAAGNYRLDLFVQ